MTFPYVAAAETDCFNGTRSLEDIILCLDQKGIDHANIITKLVEASKHNLEIKALTDKLTTLTKTQNQEIVILNNKLVKLKIQLADKLVKEIAKQSGQLTTLARKHDLEIKVLNDKLRHVTYLTQKQRQEIVILKTQVLQNQNKSSNLEQQLVDLKQALEKLKGEVVIFKQPFKLDSFKVQAFKLR
ncbi:hypothetical protein [Candidatus Marithrix sp. Canyon 246]|uniref:hypothetical protein n=1 Tax=Candidatus Marithrix sp. Canyon 246 TaxID=1827136 RepID=UPI00084A0663|nr:hypothetical protein [Candidatus Marithrix sp. Canyon 246]